MGLTHSDGSPPQPSSEAPQQKPRESQQQQRQQQQRQQQQLLPASLRPRRSALSRRSQGNDQGRGEAPPHQTGAPARSHPPSAEAIRESHSSRSSITDCCCACYCRRFVKYHVLLDLGERRSQQGGQQRQH